MAEDGRPRVAHPAAGVVALLLSFAVAMAPDNGLALEPTITLAPNILSARERTGGPANRRPLAFVVAARPFYVCGSIR